MQNRRGRGGPGQRWEKQHDSDTLWKRPLTGEDKLLSVLKVTGSFGNKNKEEGRKDRQAWQGERYLVREALID